MTVEILIGDCRDTLRALPDQSVHCCVTSPPYFGLRDYGTGEWFGGDPACAHKVGEIRTGAGMAALGEKYRGGGHKAAIVKDIQAAVECPHCGAVRVDRQIGLEATPESFVAKLVEVFREVRRVLRDDGTLWLNLGDSYAGSWGSQGRQGNTGQMADRAVADVRQKSKLQAARIEGGAYPAKVSRTGSIPDQSGLKPKDLIGIPWRVAFALQADGWYLRQDIIWHKPNPMPESVKDRCTKSHEYVFLLSKSEKYYYDAEAILEPASPNTHARLSQNVQDQIGSLRANGGTRADRPMKAVGRKFDPGQGNKNNPSFDAAMAIMPDRRNKRSVWTVTTKPFKGAHFATFPPDLIEPCILAGCPKSGTVLDPFGGAGTTGLVAERMGRNAVLCELNPDYAALARTRIDTDETIVRARTQPTLFQEATP